MRKWDFNKVAKHIFRTPLPKNASGRLLPKRAPVVAVVRILQTPQS